MRAAHQPKAALLVNFSQEFQISFDVLDAAINRCLNNMSPGVVEIARKETTHGSVIYLLAQEQLGGIGEIRVDKLSDKRTDVFFSGPRFATEHFTPMQKKAFLEGEGNLKDRAAKFLELISKTLSAGS